MRPFRGTLGFWTALFAVTWLCALDAAPALAGLAASRVTLRLLDKKVVIK